MSVSRRQLSWLPSPYLYSMECQPGLQVMAVLNEAGLAPPPPPAQPQQQAQQERQPLSSDPANDGVAAGQPTWQGAASSPLQQHQHQQPYHQQQQTQHKAHQQAHQHQQQQAAPAPAQQGASGDVLSDLAAAMADLDGGEQGAVVDQVPPSAPQRQQQQQAWGLQSPQAAGQAGPPQGGWDGDGASPVPVAFDDVPPGGSAHTDDVAGGWRAAGDVWDAAHGWGSAAEHWGVGGAASAAASSGGRGLLEQVAADIAALTSRNAALQHEIDSISVASSTGLRPWSAAAGAAAPAPQQAHRQQQEQMPPPPRLHVATGKPAPGSGTAAALLPPTPELSQS